MPSPLQVLSVSAIAWLLWRLVRRRLFPTVLENIPGPPADSWFTGSLNQIFNVKGWDYHQKLAENFEGVVRIKGVLGADELFLHDSRAMHHIFVKDQYIYEETDSFIEGNKMVFGDGIFTTLGDEHRRHRKMLNPVFSIAHMREMVPIFYEVAHKVERVFVSKADRGPTEASVDVIGWMTRLALELIGQSGLGYSFDELTENAVQHPYGIASKRLVPVQGTEVLLMMKIMPKLAKIGTPSFRRFLVDNAPFKFVKEVRDIIDILYNTSVEIFESKKKALVEGDEAFTAQVGRGKDIISILMKANMLANNDERLTDKELLGQITSLTFAATDTTSGALSRTFYLLATHKDVQNKLRDEIRRARKENGGEDIGYDELVSLPLLDAVCRETLRLYPPVSTVIRTARQDAVLPLATPIRGIDGQKISEIPVPKGTNVTVSILASNRNPELWGPDVKEWRPERWLNPLPKPLVSAHMPGIYSHLMTFIGGGRACIGFKFSQLEMKVVLALLVDQLEFSLSEKKIYWQMTGIVTPNTDPDGTNPTMPMVISMAK